MNRAVIKSFTWFAISFVSLQAFSQGGDSSMSPQQPSTGRSTSPQQNMGPIAPPSQGNTFTYQSKVACPFEDQSDKRNFGKLMQETRGMLQNLSQGGNKCPIGDGSLQNFNRAVNDYKEIQEIMGDSFSGMGGGQQSGWTQVGSGGVDQGSNIQKNLQGSPPTQGSFNMGPVASCFNYKMVYQDQVNDVFRKISDERYAEISMEYSSCVQKPTRKEKIVCVEKEYINQINKKKDECKRNKKYLKAKRKITSKIENVRTVKDTLSAVLTNPSCRKNLPETALKKIIQVGSNLASVGQAGSIAGVGIAATGQVLSSLVDALYQSEAEEARSLLDDLNSEKESVQMACLFNEWQNKIMDCDYKRATYNLSQSDKQRRANVLMCARKQPPPLPQNFEESIRDVASKLEGQLDRSPAEVIKPLMSSLGQKVNGNKQLGSLLHNAKKSLDNGELKKKYIESKLPSDVPAWQQGPLKNTIEEDFKVKKTALEDFFDFLDTPQSRWKQRDFLESFNQTGGREILTFAEDLAGINGEDLSPYKWIESQEAKYASAQSLAQAYQAPPALNPGRIPKKTFNAVVKMMRPRAEDLLDTYYETLRENRDRLVDSPNRHSFEGAFKDSVKPLFTACSHFMALGYMTDANDGEYSLETDIRESPDRYLSERCEPFKCYIEGGLGDLPDGDGRRAEAMKEKMCLQSEPINFQQKLGQLKRELAKDEPKICGKKLKKMFRWWDSPTNRGDTFKNKKLGPDDTSPQSKEGPKTYEI